MSTEPFDYARPTARQETPATTGSSVAAAVRFLGYAIIFATGALGAMFARPNVASFGVMLMVVSGAAMFYLWFRGAR